MNTPPAPTPSPFFDPDEAPPTHAELLEAYGYDLAAYDWVPVLKKPRQDGWSPAKQRAFIEALADTGSAQGAAQAVGMSVQSAYRLRRARDGQGFDRAWRAAIDAASRRLLDEAFERALVGSDEPVFNRDGERVGRRLRQSDKMLQFLLRGYFPERFGYAAETLSTRGAAGQAGSALEVEEALANLLPPPPPEPATRLDPGDLIAALEVADLCEGKLPPWLEERGVAPCGETWPERPSTHIDFPSPDQWVEEDWGQAVANPAARPNQRPPNR